MKRPILQDVLGNFHTAKARKSSYLFTPSRHQKKKRAKCSLLFLVPVIGVEPIRYHYHRILSPARLPIPPHRQLLLDYILFKKKNQAFSGYNLMFFIFDFHLKTFDLFCAHLIDISEHMAYNQMRYCKIYYLIKILSKRENFFRKIRTKTAIKTLIYMRSP